MMSFGDSLEHPLVNLLHDGRIVGVLARRPQPLFHGRRDRQRGLRADGRFDAKLPCVAEHVVQQVARSREQGVALLGRHRLPRVGRSQTPRRHIAHVVGAVVIAIEDFGREDVNSNYSAHYFFHDADGWDTGGYYYVVTYSTRIETTSPTPPSSPAR